MLVDRLEKVGRFVLWLSISSVFVTVPLVYARQEETVRRAAAAAQAAEQKLADVVAKAAEDAKPARLELKTMGRVFRALAQSEGLVAFTNVSGRAGFVCVEGIATNRDTQDASVSLASCAKVEPYQSHVQMKLMFARSELAQACKGDACDLTIRDVPDVE